MDLIEGTNGSGTVTAFPPYDAHGNDVASLTRNGTGFAIGDRRSYDAWGQVRAQQSGGGPKLRYCANLGHKADDEGGLVYMRARYYEPASGRFVSEDDAKHGSNWFVYCSGDPVNKVDKSGQNDELVIVATATITMLLKPLGSALQKILTKIFLGKIISEGAFKAAAWMERAGMGLVTSGKAQMEEGAALIRAGGDSATQAMTGGLGGISLSVSGATNLAVGVALVAASRVLWALALEYEPKPLP